jgi:hypothetical protein
VLGHPVAVAQDGDAVADREHLVEAMGDVDDRLAGPGEAPHGLEQHVDLVAGQRRGGLVEDEHASFLALVGVEGARDRHQRALGGAQAGERTLGGDLGLQAAEDLRGLPTGAPPVDPSVPARIRPPREDVLGYRQSVEEAEVLVDEPQPGARGPSGRHSVGRDLFARGVDRAAGVTAVHPGQHLDQR